MLPFSLPTYFLPIELFLTIFALFLFGSIRYRIDKNALTYGAILVIFATYYPHSSLKESFLSGGFALFFQQALPKLFSLTFLEKILHLDTMLFILGLTFFVGVIAQTRILEEISMKILHQMKGQVFKTVLIIVTLVSVASGIMDGVSMIGLTIRVLVFILVMAKIPSAEMTFVVMVSVIITTVCGMWLAYGEPPNLIMKSNLGLTNAFFLVYTMPMAVITLILVLLALYCRIKERTIPMKELDILEDHIADVRFDQVLRTGEMIEEDEKLTSYNEALGEKKDAVWDLYKKGHQPIEAMMMAEVPEETVKRFIERLMGASWRDSLYTYYLSRVQGNPIGTKTENAIMASFAVIQQ